MASGPMGPGNECNTREVSHYVNYCLNLRRMGGRRKKKKNGDERKGRKYLHCRNEVCIIFVVLDLNIRTCLVVGFDLHVGEKIKHEVCVALKF